MKEKFVKKSKNLEILGPHLCVTFSFVLMSLRKNPNFENSYLMAKKHLLFLKNTQDLTWKSFNIKLNLSEKFEKIII